MSQKIQALGEKITFSLKNILVTIILVFPTFACGADNLKTLDLKNGKKIFIVSGCASCHSDNKISDWNSISLNGGVKIETQFGDFYGPNISPDKQFGIGAWTLEQFKIALREGKSPNGSYYFPSFPYNSYKFMKEKD